jgi:hypothetical protein
MLIKNSFKKINLTLSLRRMRQKDLESELHTKTLSQKTKLIYGAGGVA